MAGNVNRWKGLVTGAAGSLLGLLAMRYYWQQVAPQVRQEAQEQRGDGEEGAELYPQGLDLDNISLVGQQHEPQESSTAAIGRHLYRAVTGHEPQSDETRELLSYLVHWGYGIAQGALYGATRAGAGFPDLRGGLARGTLLWLLGDEMVVPLAGLQSGPTAVPPEQHANRLGAHLFYGAATASSTQLLQALL